MMTAAWYRGRVWEAAPHNKRENVIVKSESVKKTTLRPVIEGIPGSGATPDAHPRRRRNNVG